MPGLIFYRGGREILRFPLTGSPLKIGRHASNDLSLPDEEVSRFHATLEAREGGYWVLDRSRNGTFLNGKRVREAPIKGGDEVGIGGLRIHFFDEAGWEDKETAVRKQPKGNSFCGMIGKSELMKRVFAMVERVAPATVTVLIMGETGTGKELVARAIHDLSVRRRGPFVPLNCGAISPQLIESELFGHERGAFTGAVSRHAGAFEQAFGGTLFLDEVGELPLELQPKLLRVLEERRFRRVGGTEESQADVRIVAATHRNLEGQVREGKFREDLFFRLYEVPIVLPPLRERGEDIALIAGSLVESLQGSGTSKKLSPTAIEKLKNHPWRGNVRELKNVMMRSLLFAEGETIDAPQVLFLTESDPSRGSALQTAEREAILKALRENQWNKKKAADVLGIAKSTLFHKIKEYQIKNS